MKAIRIHGPRDVRHEDLPDPSPGRGDVLIKVKAVGICGTDLELSDGTMFYITSGMAKLPMTPGHEWSGEVVEVGPDVTGFAPGDRVVGECTVACGSCSMCRKGWYNQCPNRTETGVLNRDGAFAEFIRYPAAFLHKANGIDFNSSALVEPTAVALWPTKLVSVCPEDYVAIMGPGPIGLFAVQTAKAYGAKKVILTGTREERLSIGCELGADATVNIREENLSEKIADLTDGHMIDVVIEAVGKPSVWPDIASVIAPRGRVAITGLFAGATCDVDFDPLVVKQITIMGTLGSPNVWEEAIDLHRRGLVRAEPLITHKMPLSKFTEAVEVVRHRKDGAVKVVVNP
jgi:L-iditol 2-dehydrogenase